MAPIASEGARPLDELRVGGLDAAAEVEVVLQADTDVAAEEDRLRHPRHLHPAQRERRPDSTFGQLVDHGGEQRRVRGGAVRNVHAQLEERRGVDPALLDELPREPEVTRVEDLHLDADPEVLDALGALTEHVRRADVDEAALPEVEAAAVQGADVGQQLLDVRQSLDATDQVGALHERRRVVRVQHEVTAHAGSGVDDDVDVAGPDPLDHLAVERHLPGALPGLRVTDADVHDGGAGTCRGDSAISSRVTGTCSDRPAVSPAPVRAQVMMTLRPRGFLSNAGAAGSMGG